MLLETKLSVEAFKPSTVTEMGASAIRMAISAVRRLKSIIAEVWV